MQYEVVFSDSFISEKDAQSRLLYAASSSSRKAQATSSLDFNGKPSEPGVELSRQREPQSSTNGDPKFKLNDEADSYESMILNGKPYLCAIPFIEAPDKNQTKFAQAKAKAQEEEAAELARATIRGWELLKDMEGNCMYFISGWWSYSFCYNMHVKQFHQLPPGRETPIYPPVEDQTTPSYVLGKFNKREDQKNDLHKSQNTANSHAVSEMQAKGETRYLVQRLGGGTTCDLTGRERRIEIQFHCHPQSADRIGWIKEISTCSYLMVIYTPRLCNDLAFLPPRDNKAHAITCREVVKEHDIPAWEQSHHPTFPPQAMGETPKLGSSRPVVAGIEVGGMRQVGKPGARLDPPTMILQPDGAVVALESDSKSEFLAQQDAHGKVEVVSDEHLRKMGLEPKDVADVRQRLQEAAKGKPWKLEVYDAPGGREFRAIFEEGEEGMLEWGSGEEEKGKGNAKEGEAEGESEEGSVEDYKDEL